MSEPKLPLELDVIGPALAYDVFILGEKYMDSVATTNTNSISFTPPMDPLQEFYYSVRARGLEGWTGLRTIAQSHSGGELNCVIDPPSASMTISNNNLCISDEVIYTSTSTSGGGALSFDWDFGIDATPTTANTVGPHTVSYSSTGSKTVALDVTNSTGTDGASESVEVVDEPISDFSTAINNLEVTFTNSSTNASSYFWDFGDGNNSSDENPVHTYASNIPYEVILTAINGSCEEDYTETVFLNVGINDTEVSYSILLMPNPASNQTIISLSDDVSRSYEINIVNMVGQHVSESIHTSSANTVSQRIDLSQLQSGLYFVKIRSEKQETWRKLMVNN